MKTLNFNHLTNLVLFFMPFRSSKQVNFRLDCSQTLYLRTPREASAKHVGVGFPSEASKKNICHGPHSWGPGGKYRV